MAVRFYVRRVISGGQTGVDRAALDWALALGLPHGGWCPRGRRAEDGPIASRYQLQETPSERYADRTRRNALESDATLVLNAGVLEAGTRLTVSICERARKPVHIVQLADVTPERDVERVRAWLQANRVAVLNIAGPRESKRPGIYQRARDFLVQLADA
jgi:Circularly permutated YpsA SLOG family